MKFSVILDKILNRKPAQPVEVADMRTPEEIATDFINFADGLFREAHEARVRAAEVFASAAVESKQASADVLRFAEEAYESGKARAARLAELGEQRATEAAKNSKIAEKLSEFI